MLKKNLKIKRILIANRGEITVRILRTLRSMNIQSVVMYANDDAGFDYLNDADIKVSLGQGSLLATYLNQEKIIQIAIENQVDAIHPGYGFLSENDQFAQKIMEAGLIWIGPDPEHIRLMGNKLNARSFAKKIGIPVVDIWSGSSFSLSHDKSIELPVIAKPANGGGGKGMRKIMQFSEMAESLERTAAEAKRYFGDATVYLEKYISVARHIEVQILADHFGNAVHLYERECSVQRRYQKVIEEAPAANISAELKQKLHSASLLLVKEVGYKNAGTVEFIVDPDENFYFLEMNTRIQVEHPVTEEITGIDLIEQQILIAEKKQMKLSQAQIQQKGVAIEARLYAEDPFNNFIPSAGKLHRFSFPKGNYRVDTFCTEGNNVSTSYDPMLAKIIVSSTTRDAAINELQNVLKKTVVHGVETNKAFLSQILAEPDFAKATIHTTWCDDIAQNLESGINMGSVNMAEFIAGYILSKTQQKEQNAANGAMSSLWQEVGYWRNYCRMNLRIGEENFIVHWRFENNNVLQLTIEEKNHQFFYERINSDIARLFVNGLWKVLTTSTNNTGLYYISLKSITVNIEENLKSNKSTKTKSQVNGLHSSIVSPLPGKVIKIHTPEGTHVKKGDALIIIESMKMENKVVAVSDSTIKKVLVVEGQQLEGSEVLLELEHKTFSN